jgi:uncharacterized protein
VQGVSDYVLNLYLRAADGVTVNMYAPSELRFEQNSVKIRLTQETDYPSGENVSMRIDSNAAQVWTLRLRIPGWLEGPARITLNGAAAAPGTPGNFAALRRRWKRGDQVELRLPQTFRSEPIDDLHPNVVAVMRGPLMLIAIDPPDGMDKRPLTIEEGFRPLGQRAGAWTRNEGGQQTVFVPFYQVQNEQYTTYFTRG